MRQHENICVFYKKQCTYNPQMIKKSYLDKRTKSGQIENVDVYNSFTKVERQKNREKVNARRKIERIKRNKWNGSTPNCCSTRGRYCFY